MQYGQRSILDELKYQFRSGGIVTQLILVNLVCFAAVKIVEIALWFGGIEATFIAEWLFLPSSLQSLLYRLYTFLTYQFLHAGFWHILFNMIVLFWFGKILTTFIDAKRVLPLYLLGGLAGAILFLLVYNLSPSLEQGAFLVGASASIMALVGATAMIAPNYEIRVYFLFNIKLKYVVALLAVFNLFTLQGDNSGGKIAHLGGLAFGALAIFLHQKYGWDVTKPFIIGYEKIKNSTIFKKRPTMATSHRRRKKTTSQQKTVTVITGNQDKIDAILDKISENGYESLNKAEKDFLFTMSKKK